MSKPDEEWLFPADVARLFKVSPKTVTRWAATGLLPSVTTPGGHHRFARSEIERIWRERGYDKR